MVPTTADKYESEQHHNGREQLRKPHDSPAATKTEYI